MTCMSSLKSFGGEIAPSGTTLPGFNKILCFLPRWWWPNGPKTWASSVLSRSPQLMKRRKRSKQWVFSALGGSPMGWAVVPAGHWSEPLVISPLGWDVDALGFAVAMGRSVCCRGRLQIPTRRTQKWSRNSWSGREWAKEGYRSWWVLCTELNTSLWDLLALHTSYLAGQTMSV